MRRMGFIRHRSGNLIWPVNERRLLCIYYSWSSIGSDRYKKGLLMLSILCALWLVLHCVYTASQCDPMITPSVQAISSWPFESESSSVWIIKACCQSEFMSTHWYKFCYFPQGTFFGRYRHFLDIIDPRTLFTSKVRVTVTYSGFHFIQLEMFCHIKSEGLAYNCWKFSYVKRSDMHCPEIVLIQGVFLVVRVFYYLILQTYRNT